MPVASLNYLFKDVICMNFVNTTHIEEELVAISQSAKAECISSSQPKNTCNFVINIFNQAFPIRVTPLMPRSLVITHNMTLNFRKSPSILSPLIMFDCTVSAVGSFQVLGSYNLSGLEMDT